MNDDSGTAKGGFWDRIRVRFQKIIKKLRLLKNKFRNNPSKYDEEKLLKKKKEEELYNYYKNRNTKSKLMFVNQTLTNNKQKFRLKNNSSIKKKNGIAEQKVKKEQELNKKKDTENKNSFFAFQTIFPKIKNKENPNVKINKKTNNEGINNILINENRKKYNKLNTQSSVKENPILRQQSNSNIKNKNIVRVSHNVGAFNKIGKSNKFSLKKKNKFNKFKKVNSSTTKKAGIITPIINKISSKNNSLNPKVIKEKQEIKKAFSMKEIDLTKFNKVNNELDKKLEKQKEISERLSKLVNQIEPEKKIDVQYHFINNLFSNLKNLFLSVISIPLLKRPKNIPLFSVGLFMLNNSVRNMRKMITRDEKIRFIPSNTYIDAIKENINNFELIDYMIDDSLAQISSLKYEYQHEFGEYSDSKQFRDIIDKLNSYENGLREKQKKILKEKEKMNTTLDKNCKKLQLIKDMND